jgi:signal transduction histidine kinase
MNQPLSISERGYKFLIILIVVLSSIVCIISLVEASRWINKPFPGFLFYKNLVVTDTSHNIGGKVGLKRVSDRIVEVNGKKVSSAEDIYKVVDSLPLGTLVNYRISRNDEFIELSIPIVRFTLRDFLFLFGVIYLVGLIFFVVGACVYYLKPSSQSSKIFFILCSLVGIWFVTSFHSQSTYLFNLFDKLAFFGFIYCPALGIYLASVFPSNGLFLRKNQHILFLIAFIFSTFLFIVNFIYFDSYSIWKDIYSSTWLYLVLGSLMLPISSALAYFKGFSTLERQRAQVILLGSLVGLFLPALVGISIVVFRANIPFNLLALPVIFFPISIAYAIVKHNLFDIDIIIQKALVYSTLTAVVGGVLVLMVIAFNVAFASYGGWRNPVFFVVLSTFLVIALNPLKNQIQNFIDLSFFRTKYDYRRIIEEISFVMTSLLNLDDITDKIISTIGQTMFSNPVSVILFDENSGDYRVYAKSKEADIRTTTIQGSSKLIQLLNRYKKEIFKEDLIADDRYMKHRDTLMKLFNDFNAALFIPMFFKKELIGILSLGEKRSGLSYNSQDIKLLRILANQSAIAIENAFAYKLVEDYAKKLEEANKELRETQAQLIQAEKMSAIGQLAAGIAHEIRNPLNIIEGARYYLYQMVDGENSEIIREYLDYIKHEVERTNHLIDSLLKLSKMEPPHFESVNINTILQNTLVLVRKQISDSKIELITNLDPHIPRIMADPNQLWQVFINILINAIQAMPSGGKLQIDTGLCKERLDHVFISFRDTGVGIDEEDLPKIFDPFFTKKSTGTGLGLSVSYKIIEGHKGKITVSSEKEKGTTFVIELPLNHNTTRMEDA